MMYLKECLTDSTNILIIGESYRNRENRGLEKKIFRKNFNHAEIIGEELCSIRNLSCPHFFLVLDSKDYNSRLIPYRLIREKYPDIKLGTYDFREEGYIYFNIGSVFNRDSETKLLKVLSMTPTLENREELKKEICELFALDVYMGQVDRFSSNIMFSFNTRNGDIHLAPIYDFQYSLKSSYIDQNKIYDNHIHSFNDFCDFYNFILEYPEFRDMLKSYLDVDLVQVVRDGYRKKGLVVPNEKIEFYSSFDESRKGLIKRIVF